MKQAKWIQFILLVGIVFLALACKSFGPAAPTPFGTGAPSDLSELDATLTALYSVLLTPPVTPTPLGTSASMATAVPVATETPQVAAVTATPTYPIITVMPPATQGSTPGAPASTTATPSALVRTITSVSARYLSAAPAIDGSFGEWNLPWVTIGSVTYGVDQWVGAADLSGSTMVGWDDKNLYLAVRVYDEKYIQNGRGEMLFKGDSLEVLLDTKLAVDFYTDSLSPDDFQLGISPGSPNVGSALEAYLWYPRSIEGWRSQVSTAALVRSDGYDVEVAVPWSVFEVLPQVGAHYGFAISISDNDTAGGTVQQSMVSNVSSRHLTMPTTWGDLVLLGP